MARDTELPPGHIKVRSLAGADGLHNMVITNIAQDEHGYLWLGTEDGLYGFDGDRFRHFGVEDGLASSLVYSLAIAPTGELCVGSYNGLACRDGAKFSRAGGRGLPLVNVFAMVTRGDALWVATTQGLYVRAGTGAFVRAPGWPAPGAPVRGLWADATGLVAAEGTAVRLSTGDGVWHALGEVGLGDEPIEGVLRDHQGALWLRSQSHVWLLPRGEAVARDVRDGLAMNHGASWAPTAMVIDPHGEVVIGTATGIAYREGDHWRTIDHTLGLPDGEVRTLFVDREGTTWLGGVGLVQLRGRGVLEYHNNLTGLPGEIAWSFRRDPGGALWVGTNRCLARAAGGRWVCLPASEGRTIRGIAFPPQGGVFIAGVPANPLYIDPEGHATPIGDLGPDRMTLAVAIAPDGDLYLATDSGLFRLRGAVPGPLEQVTLPGIPDTAWFSSLAVAGDQLWTGASPGGAIVLDHGQWRTFGSEAGLRMAPSYLATRADGRICTAYIEAVGLSCFRYDGHTLRDVEHIDATNGLTTGMVYYLGEDRAGRLWVGTGDAVDVVSPAGIDHFDDSDGLAGNDSSATAFLLDSDGSLWLGANGGATHVLTERYTGLPAAPTSRFIAGQLGALPLNELTAAGATREVPHDHSGLSLELAASSLLDAKRLEYQTRLGPIEAAWSTTPQRQARYPALLPGAYQLAVRSRIGHGPWGPVRELGFRVLPAWWQTGWFIALAALAALAMVGAGFAWRQRVVLRRRMQRFHEQSDASIRTVVDMIPELISVCRDDKVIYLNAANRRFFGIDDVGGGLEMSPWVHPDDRAQIAALVRQALQPNISSELCELRLRAADGSWRSCEISAVLVEIAGRPTVVTSARDVTERKRMRAKMLVSERMASLGTLAAGIAHEINNPLSYVAGNLEVAAETLAEQGGDAGELAAAISDARDGAERVRKIVHGLRAFSRAEDERRVSLALPGVLDTAIRMTSNEVRHRAELVRELGPTPLVIADDSRLTQVFINLLVNAAHAIDEGRTGDHRITVRSRTDEQGRAVVEVEDTGRGMPADVVSRVFDPFFTTKDVGEGTGLGLSICHGVVTSIGGQISVDSTVGKGTVVRVVLPGNGEAPVAAIEAAAAPARATAPARRHRVLLVDDEPQVAHTTERLLRKHYDVTVALCGRDAIEHVARGAWFDAIVSDVMMPNMTGIEMVEELRRLAPAQVERLIFLSGGAFTAQTRAGLDQIGAPYLEKPVTAKELRGWVARMVERSQPQAA